MPSSLGGDGLVALQGLLELGAVVADVAHRRVHRPEGQHLLGGRLQQLGQLLGVGVVRVQPGVPGLGGQDHRHAVVDRLHQVVGRGGQDGAGPQLVAVAVLALAVALVLLVLAGRRVAPGRPQPGQGQRAEVAGGDVEGLLALALALVLPLVEAVDGDDAALAGQGALPALFLAHRLGPEVDHLVGPAGVLGPAGHQPPFQGPELAGPVGRGCHDQDVAGRGHVPAGLVALDPERLGPELLEQELELAGGAEASAHASTLPDNPDSAAPRPPSGEQLLAEPAVAGGDAGQDEEEAAPHRGGAVPELDEHADDTDGLVAAAQAGSPSSAPGRRRDPAQGSLGSTCSAIWVANSTGWRSGMTSSSVTPRAAYSSAAARNPSTSARAGRTASTVLSMRS